MITDKIVEQILDIRNSAMTNMFDTVTVQRIANDRGYYELVIFIEEHKRKYAQFILTGDRR